MKVEVSGGSNNCRLLALKFSYRDHRKLIPETGFFFFFHFIFPDRPTGALIQGTQAPSRCGLYRAIPNGDTALQVFLWIFAGDVVDFGMPSGRLGGAAGCPYSVD